jgi:hypothetical protein
MFTGKTDGSVTGNAPVSLFVIDDLNITGGEISSSLTQINYPATASARNSDNIWKPILPQTAIEFEYGRDLSGQGYTGTANNVWYPLNMVQITRSFESHVSSSREFSTLETTFNSASWIEPKIPGIYELYANLGNLKLGGETAGRELSLQWKRSGSDQSGSDEIILTTAGMPTAQAAVENYQLSTGYVYGNAEGSVSITLNQYAAANPFREDKFTPCWRNVTTDDSTAFNGISIGAELIDYLHTAVHEDFEDVTSGYRLTGNVTSTGLYGNTWYFSNDSIQQWVISSSASHQGSSGLYTSWTGSNYAAETTESGVSARSYAWTEFYLPKNTDFIDIDFWYRQNKTIGSHELNVWLAPATVAPPSASVAYSSSYLLEGNFNDQNASSNFEHYLPVRLTASLDNTDFSDKKHRLVFGWETTGTSLGAPLNYAAIDNVNVIFKTK